MLENSYLAILMIMMLDIFIIASASLTARLVGYLEIEKMVINKSKSTVIMTVLVVFSFVFPYEGKAATDTSWGTISFVTSGWNGEGFAFTFSGSTSVPCVTSPIDEFAVPITHKSYNEMFAMVLGAYMMKSKVVLVINDGVCTIGRTSVLAIQLQP